MGRYSNRPAGVVLYDGPSVIDGKPIVLVATFKTDNDKTGNLIQTWILRKHVHPVEAINNGGDKSICGDCPLRGILELQKKSNYKSQRTKAKSRKHVNRERGCYVAVQNAPRAIWGAYKSGNYPAYDEAEHRRWFKMRGLRLGSYGDPCAVPFDVWEPILSIAPQMSQPGYTHQWRTCDQRWRHYIMASTHSLTELDEANTMGWRSYRTRRADQPLAENEIVCPASEEAGYRDTCETCGACDGCKPGQDAAKRRNIAMIVHGGDSKITGALAVIDAA